MDQDMGSRSAPPQSGSAPPQSGPIDKSKVLDVKPIRFLVPVFPSPTGMAPISTIQPSPFGCISPSGPFLNGVQPFYPFVLTNGSKSASFRNLGFGGGSNARPASRGGGIGQVKRGRGRPRSISKVVNM